MTQEPMTSPSPAQAREMLREADTTADAAARWRPARWAVAVVSLSCTVTAALAVLGAWWLMLAAWALTLVLGVVLRSRLTRPGLRQDPWADPLAQGRDHWARTLASGFLPLGVIAARASRLVAARGSHCDRARGRRLVRLDASRFGSAPCLTPSSTRWAGCGSAPRCDPSARCRAGRR